MFHGDLDLANLLLEEVFFALLFELDPLLDLIKVVLAPARGRLHPSFNLFANHVYVAFLLLIG